MIVTVRGPWPLTMVKVKGLRPLTVAIVKGPEGPLLVTTVDNYLLPQIIILINLGAEGPKG